MPRIPIYDQPQVQVQGVQGGMRQQTRSNAAEFLGMAGQAAQIGLQAKDQAETYRAEGAFNQLQEKKIGMWGEVQQLNGSNAMNVHKDYLAKYDEESAKLAGTMGTGAAAKFSQAAARGRLAFSSQLEGHQTQQVEAVKQQVNLSGIGIELDDALKNSGTPIAEQAISRATFLAGQEADRRGLRDAAYSDYVMGVMSKGHMANLGGMLDKYPAAAAKYLEDNKDAMTGADYASAKKHVGISTAFDLGQAVAQENVEAFLGDENKRDGIPEAGILGNILQDARLKGNEQATQHALATAKILISTQRADWKEQSNRHIANVMDVSNQKGAGVALRSSAFKLLQAVDPIEADSIKNHLLGEMDAARSRANQEPADPAMIAKRGFLFNDLLYQAAHGKPDGRPLTRDDVVASSITLGKQYTASLVSTLGDMQRSPVKVQHYTVDNDLLASSLRKAGFIGDKKNDRADSLIGDLHAKVLIMQSASQQPWSQENTQKLIDSLIMPIITNPDSEWHLTSPNGLKLDLANYKNGSKWNSDITPGFKAEGEVPQAFVAEHIRRNPNATRNATTQAYYLAKKQGLVNEDGSLKGAK